MHGEFCSVCSQFFSIYFFSLSVSSFLNPERTRSLSLTTIKKSNLLRQPLGLRRQGRPQKRGRRPLCRGKLLGPHARCRVVVDRPGVVGRVWPLHARVREHPLQRHPGPAEGAGGKPEHRGVYGGADPGARHGGRGGSGRERCFFFFLSLFFFAR